MPCVVCACSRRWGRRRGPIGRGEQQGEGGRCGSLKPQKTAGVRRGRSRGLRPVRLTNLCHCNLQVDVHESAPHGASHRVPPALSVNEVRVGLPSRVHARGCDHSRVRVRRNDSKRCVSWGCVRVCAVVRRPCCGLCERGWGSRQRLCERLCGLRVGCRCVASCIVNRAAARLAGRGTARSPGAEARTHTV